MSDAEGRQLDAGRPMQRALLALLLLDPGRVVPIATIVDGLWGDDPPPSVENSIQGYVSRLRKVLLSDSRLERAGRGYKLDVSPEDIDVVRFERLATEGRSSLARGEASVAAASLGRALTLYRGPALAEFADRPFAAAPARRIERMVHAAEEDLVDARLALGQHDDLLAQIERLVEAEPLSERRWGQLMTTLYRCGRQGDALEAYQRARRALVEALGLEPGPELRRIESEILGQSLPDTAPLPRGVVTFLLTDVEGSVRMWERAPDAMASAIARHDEIVRDLVGRNNGMLRKTRGEGDSTFSVFVSATNALEAALALQRAFAGEEWPEPVHLSVRASVHAGEAELRDADYYGPAVNRAARVRGLAQGGQVLVTEATAALVSDALPSGAGLRDLGKFRLRDLTRSERLFQLTHPALPDDFATLVSTEARVSLPSRSSSFVGREREVDDVVAALAGDRLVTLTGPGGCGKTSLGVAVAGATAHEYDDGVVFVDLAPVDHHELVPNAVATALGIRERPGQTVTESVAEYLGHQRRLVLIDNCEHVTDAAREVVDAVLRAGPYVRVLATSREHLGLAGEVIWPVPSLGNEVATRLFEDRAKAASAAFDVVAHHAAIVRLCERVDGMPLAIELAAARVSVLSVDQIITRLDDALRVLDGDANHSGPTRQRTLRATFEWSYNLLSRAEQVLFARLAVFTGGFTLDAVEAIAGGAEVAAEDAIGYFVRLVDKSLVLRAGDSPELQPRYRLLEPLRQFAQSRLSSEGTEAEMRDRHLEYYAQLAEEMEPNLYVAGSRQWLDRISDETANIRSALEWGLSSEGGDSDAGARLFAALRWAWYATGRHGEGRGWVDLALEATEDRPSLLRGRVLVAASLFAAGESDFDAVADLGIETLTLGDHLSLPYLQAYGRDMLGIARWVRGDFDEAVTLHRRSIDLFDQCGDRFNAALACAEYGRDLAAAGRRAEAQAAFDAGVARARDLNEHTVLGFALDASALFALGTADLSAAATLIDEAVEHYRASGFQEGVASGLNTRGQLSVAAGDIDAAEADFIEAIELCRRLGHRGGAATGLDGLARVAEHHRGLADAVKCCAAAAGLRARAGIGMTPQEQANIDPLVGRLRAGLGDHAFDAAWADGTRRGLDDLHTLIAVDAPAPVAG